MSRASYDDWHRSIGTMSEKETSAPWHEAARAYLGRLSGWRVFEIGCGRGAFARAATHEPDPRRAVGQLASVLTRGGTLLLTTPNHPAVVGAFRSSEQLRGDPFTGVGGRSTTSSCCPSSGGGCETLGCGCSKPAPGLTTSPCRRAP